MITSHIPISGELLFQYSHLIIDFDEQKFTKRVVDRGKPKVLLSSLKRLPIAARFSATNFLSSFKNSGGNTANYPEITELMAKSHQLEERFNAAAARFDKNLEIVNNVATRLNDLDLMQRPDTIPYPSNFFLVKADQKFNFHMQLSAFCRERNVQPCTVIFYQDTDPKYVTAKITLRTMSALSIWQLSRLAFFV